MVAGIHVRGSAGHIAREVAHEPRGHGADIFDRHEPPRRRPRASLIDELVEMLNPGCSSCLERANGGLGQTAAPMVAKR
jgi:hypothetical protein